MTERARELYQRGDLLGAAKREAAACERDGYDITAAIIRDLAALVSASARPGCSTAGRAPEPAAGGEA